jgi:hypothetical protein
MVQLSERAPSGRDPLGAFPNSTVDRVFRRDQELIAYVEAYEKDDKAPHRLTFVASLQDAGGQRRTLASEVRMTVGKGQKRNVYAFTRSLPLGNVPAGPYVLRIEVRSDAQADRSGARLIPINVQ